MKANFSYFMLKHDMSLSLVQLSPSLLKTTIIWATFRQHKKPKMDIWAGASFNIQPNKSNSNTS